MPFLRAKTLPSQALRDEMRRCPVRMSTSIQRASTQPLADGVARRVSSCRARRSGWCQSSSSHWATYGPRAADTDRLRSWPRISYGAPDMQRILGSNVDKSSGGSGIVEVVNHHQFSGGMCLTQEAVDRLVHQRPTFRHHEARNEW